MVLKRLKYTNFSVVWHERLPSHKHECRKGSRNLKILEKRLFSQLWVEKTNITTFGPLRKTFEKIH